MMSDVEVRMWCYDHASKTHAPGLSRDALARSIYEWVTEGLSVTASASS